MSVSLGELAVRFGCELRGDPDTRIDAVAPLGSARAQALSFLANPRYSRALATTRASAVVVDSASAAASPVPCLISDNPYATYARIAAYLFPPPPVTPGIHSSAVVDRGARIDPTAHVEEPGAACQDDEESSDHHLARHGVGEGQEVGCDKGEQRGPDQDQAGVGELQRDEAHAEPVHRPGPQSSRIRLGPVGHHDDDGYQTTTEKSAIITATTASAAPEALTS